MQNLGLKLAGLNELPIYTPPVCLEHQNIPQLILTVTVNKATCLTFFLLWKFEK